MSMEPALARRAVAVDRVDNVKEFAILTFDPKGRITTWNPGAERMFGYTESEMLGQSVDAIYTLEDSGC